jgi:hypothetical protein
MYEAVDVTLDATSHLATILSPSSSASLSQSKVNVSSGSIEYAEMIWFVVAADPPPDLIKYTLSSLALVSVLQKKIVRDPIFPEASKTTVSPVPI